MDQQETIRLLYESEGKSLREICRITGKDFRTVQKYAYQEDWRPPGKEALRPENFRVIGPYISIIDGWLEEDKKAPRKQRHTGRRIFDRLRAEHKFKGSYDSVKRYLRRKREVEGHPAEGFLPLEQPPCHAQVDFGDFAYFDASGTQRGGHALTLAFPHSNAGWTQVFPSENQECLLEGLRRIFYHIGGVPQRVRCDNMSTAVAQVLQGRERVVSDGFRRFMRSLRSCRLRRTTGFRRSFATRPVATKKGTWRTKLAIRGAIC